MLLRQLGKQIIKFESEQPYFQKEFLGKKRNTVRVVDYLDKKFKLLASMEIMNKYGFIKIMEKVKDKRKKPLKFTRKIKDVSFWKDLVVISW